MPYSDYFKIKEPDDKPQFSVAQNQSYDLPEPDATEKPQEKWDYSTSKVGMNGDALPPGALGWRPDGSPDWGEGIDAFIKKRKYMLSQAWQTGWKEGERIKDEAGYESDLMPRLVSAWNTTKSIAGAMAEPVFWALGKPAQLLEQTGGSVGLALQDMVYGGKGIDEINWKGNWEASRIAYSIALRPFLLKDGTQGIKLRDEFINRMANGERPEIIAEDMMMKKQANIWVELGGQLIFDPLNAFGKVSKTKQAARFTELGKLDTAVIYSDDARDAIAMMEKATDPVERMRHLYQASEGLLRGVDESVDSLAALSKPGAPKAKLAARYKDLFQLTPASRAEAQTVRCGTMLKAWHTQLGGNPAKMLELMDAMKTLAHGTDAEKAKALLWVADSGIPFESMFSKAGNDTIAIIAKMAEEHGDGLRKVFGVTKGVDKLGDVVDAERALQLAADGEKAVLSAGDQATYLLKTFQNTINDMFPSAKSILEAEKVVKEAKDISKVSKKTQQLADIAKNMSASERRIAQIHNMAQDKGVGMLNKMFSKVYLGLSPGYAFRNMSQNNFQMWLDYGSEIFFGAADEMAEGARLRNGGMTIYAGEKFGSASIDSVTELEKTDFFSMAKRWTKGWGDMRVVAENAEARASRRIASKMYNRAFDHGLSAVVKDAMKDKRFAGLTKEAAGLIESELRNTFGDVPLAIKNIKGQLKNGYIRPFTDAKNVPGNIKLFMGDIGSWDRFVTEVLGAASEDDAIVASKQILEEAVKRSGPGLVADIATDVNDNIQQAVAVAIDEGAATEVAMRKKQAVIYGTDKAIDALTNIVKQVAQKYDPSAALQNKYIEPLQGWTKNRDMVRKATDQFVTLLDTMGNNPQKAWSEITKIIGVPKDIPVPLDKKAFRKMAWEELFKWQNATYGQDVAARFDSVEQYVKAVAKDQNLLDSLAEARKMFDETQSLVFGEGGVALVELPLEGPRMGAITTLAAKYGISSVTKSGAWNDQMLLNIINKYAGINFSSLNDDISLEMVNRAFAKSTGKTALKLAGEVAEEAGKVVDEAAQVATEVAPEAAKTMQIPENARFLPSSPNSLPNKAESIIRNNPIIGQDVEKFIRAKFAETVDVVDNFSEQQWVELEKHLSGRMTTVRTVSQNVAKAHRDFTLLNYGKETYRGVLASYAFPYYKWYAGTYGNYAKRILSNPTIISHYQMLKDALALEHSNLPEWYKYQINTDDLLPETTKEWLGLDDNPLFFNIEATIWPLQGLTGIDFNDKEKVVDWWTFTLDQMGKYGPTVWTPITFATGMSLQAMGQRDAGRRWVGRMSSVTATAKSTLAAAGVDINVGPIKHNEFDPFVNLFEEGLDPYEEQRVRRALGYMIQNNPDPEFQAAAIDAANSHSGPLWDEAIKQAGKDRATGNILSTVFGVGLKARTKEDIEIDRFYSDYAKLMNVRPNLSPEDFRNQMALLGEKYPFMDTVLIGNKASDVRDAAFAYNVLSRIAPGDMSGLLEYVGVRSDTIDYFYEKKGDMSEMAPDDRMRFNSAMLTLAAIYQIPDRATKQEWNTAKYQYEQAQIRSGFQDEEGEPTAVGTKYQTYLSLLDIDRRQANEYLNANADLQQAMDLKNAYIANNPILNAYYGGIETIERYYQSQVRAQMVARYGKEIYVKYDFYNSLLDEKQKRAYLKANPDLDSFKKEKDEWQELVNRKTAEFASRMPEAKTAGLREAMTPTQETLQQMGGTPQRSVTKEQLTSQMSPALLEAIRMYQRGGELSYTAQQQIGYVGDYFGLTANEVLQILLME